ncbi:plastocyanin/azurin family copper-binding protein [Fodinibius sp. SL11]|uniref:plastocyanin/azurin family copper-binding protein n=1 Tax=Fodinibius sp. SL11 TaxID=3425690 RepID=UPI003F881AB2
MKVTNILLSLSLLLFLLGCGSGETSEREPDESQQAEEQKMEQPNTMSQDVRTIDIIGIDEMKFAVESEMDDITVGQTTGKEGNLLLLETIEVSPGEEIRIHLTTKSQLPPSAMAHNWILMVLGADANAYVSKASAARDQDYMPNELSDQVLFHTELVGGGGTTEVTFTAPSEPGDYEYLCSFPGHYSAGMKGFLVVKSEDYGLYKF